MGLKLVLMGAGKLMPLLTLSLLRGLSLSIILAVTIGTFFEDCIEK